MGMLRRLSAWACLGGLVTGLVAACGHDSARIDATLLVTPSSANYDVPLTIDVRGLPADRSVTLTLAGTDGEGVRWSARADFRAGEQGTVSTRQAPVSGSYHGVDPMGLFESMTPPAAAPANDDVFRYGRAGRVAFRLEARVGGALVASQVVTRTLPDPTERSFTLAHDGFVGTLFTPAAEASAHPAVLVFGGSEGGESQDPVAQLLAGRGYPALSLAYFKEPGLPSTLAGIDLRYFVKALQTLARQPGVDPNALVVEGVSRGSEAAQLLGSHFPALVHGVIAGVPSSVVNGPYPRQATPSWLLDGHVLPEVPTYLYGDADPVGAPAAIIPDERIHGPILLDCGGQDLVWPSCSYLGAITQRLKDRHFAYAVTAIQYPDAGHGAGVPSRYNSATPQILVDHGGDLLATIQAESDFYQHVLDFLGALAK